MRTIEIASSSNTTFFCPYCTSNFLIKSAAERHIIDMHDDEFKTTIPVNFEKRLKELEKKADDLLPGDYTLRANFFTDDDGKDVHLVAVHNLSVNNNKVEYRLHEGGDEIRVEWVNKVETR